MTVKKSRPLLFNLTHLWSSVSSTSRKRQNIIGQIKVIQFLLILKYFGGKKISSLKVSHNCFSLLRETSLNLSLQLACGSRPLCWHRERSDPHAVSCSFSFSSSSLNKAHSSACCQLFPWFLLPVMPLHLITFPRPEVPIVIFSVLLIVLNLCYLWETQNSSIGKESACNAGDPGLIPGLGRSPEEEKGYPLQYSGLENSMDCIVLGVTKSQTQLSNFHSRKSHQCNSTIGRILWGNLQILPQTLLFFQETT